MKRWIEKKHRYADVVIFIAVILFLIIFLFDFSKVLENNEKSRKYRELNRSVRQDAQIMQNRLDRYFAILEANESLLKNQNLSSMEKTEFLEQLKKFSTTEFIHIGAADTTGRAVMSDGEEMQIGEKEFFKEAVSGNNYITENEQGDTFTAAIPIRNGSQTVSGVLFGEVKLENIEPAGQENEFNGLSLIDEEGNNILGNFSSGQKNLFQTLTGSFEKTEYGITDADQIREYMENDEDILYVMDFHGQKVVAVIAPVACSDWYVFEEAGWEEITKEINYYQKHMILLTVKILLLFLVLGMIYVRYAVGERKKIEKLYTDLCLNEEAYQVTVKHSNQCIFTYDAIEEKIYFVNDNYKKFGIQKQCVELSWLLEKLKHNNMSECARISRIASSVLEHVPEIERELYLRVDGQERFLKVWLVNLFDKNGLISRSIGIVEDITEQKTKLIKLEKEATTDALTGALKRQTAGERIDQIVQRPLPEGYCHVFMVLDMDNFKQLNDGLGHMCGDRALADFVAAAEKNCRRDDIICRLGGDEFVIFLNEMDRNAVEKKLRQLQEVFCRTYEKDGISVTVGVSMGVALVPDHGSSFNGLYASADKALYKAKTSGKGCYCIAQQEK